MNMTDEKNMGLCLASHTDMHTDDKHITWNKTDLITSYRMSILSTPNLLPELNLQH